MKTNGLSFIKTIHIKVSKVTAKRVDMAQKLELQKAELTELKIYANLEPKGSHVENDEPWVKGNNSNLVE